MKVELIFDSDCPNVNEARSQLQLAHKQAGVAPSWIEWNRGDEKSPAYVKKYGSPTILVNGQDVAGAIESDGADCCRLYLDDEGKFKGVPSVEVIVKAFVL